MQSGSTKSGLSGVPLDVASFSSASISPSATSGIVPSGCGWPSLCLEHPRDRWHVSRRRGRYELVHTVGGVRERRWWRRDGAVLVFGRTNRAGWRVWRHLRRHVLVHAVGGREKRGWRAD